jgi:histidinol-phosphate aminotransferase
MTGNRRSRRDVLGGLVSAAAAGVAVPGLAQARPAAGEIRRTSTVLRLGSNENATGLGPAARAAFLAAIDDANRYPGRVWETLIEALTSHHQVDASWIHLTPGSGALLSAATLAFTGASRSLVTAAPTFEAPARTARRTGATVHAVPVTAEGRLDLEAMLAKAPGAALFFVCNPNNPTGGSVPGTALTAFVASLQKAAPEARVLVDEAYFEYADEPGYATAVPLAVADRRVIVTRTFSKLFGMAGLRVGYAIAHPDTIAALEAHGPNGTLSNASLAAAAAAFTDTSHIAAERARNRAVREATRQRFEAAGYRVLPSAANFVMVDVRRDAGAFGWACRQQRIAVARPFPPLSTFLRLTIGTQAEMDEAVPAILSLLDAPASARAEPTLVDWSAGAGC